MDKDAHIIVHWENT